MLSKHLPLNLAKNTRLSAVIGCMTGSLAQIVVGTKGLNVSNVIASTSGKGDYMIWLNISSFAIWITAMVVILPTNGLPLVNRVRAFGFHLAGAAFLVMSAVFFWVIFCPLTGVLAAFFYIGRVLAALAFPFLIWVVSGILFFSLSLTRYTVPLFIPRPPTAPFTRFPIVYRHKKIPLPECLTRGLHGTILSGQLPWPRVLGVLMHSPGLLFATPVLYQNTGEWSKRFRSYVIMLSTALFIVGIVCLFAVGLKVQWSLVEFLPLGLAFIAAGVLL